MEYVIAIIVIGGFAALVIRSLRKSKATGSGGKSDDRDRPSKQP